MQESKNPLWELVQETQSKAMTQMCQQQPWHCLEAVGEEKPEQCMELSSNTQSHCTHQKHPGKDSSKEDDGEGFY